MSIQRFEVSISLADSNSAGSVRGVWSDLDGLLASGWHLRAGPSSVEMVVDYAYSTQSRVELKKYIAIVTYPFFTLIEGLDTAHCRVVSLLDDNVGVVVSFRGSGHPRPERPFRAAVRVVA